MNQATSLHLLQQNQSPTMQAPAEMQAGFTTVGGFELMQRAAKLLSNSTIVPVQYRAVDVKKNTENPAAISNCVVALNMAQRMGADPLMIMQNLYIVEGRPAWSSQYIIASINACGKYSPLRFDIETLGEKEVEWVETKWENRVPVKSTRKTKIQDMKCIAWAIEKSTGERLESPPITIELAVKEGWYPKNGSKWQTMPEVMLRYRAASFFGKLYAPELLMGLQTTEEIQDMTVDVLPNNSGVYSITTDEITPKGEPETVQTEPQPNTTKPPTKAQVKKMWLESGRSLSDAENFVEQNYDFWVKSHTELLLGELERMKSNSPVEAEPIPELAQAAQAQSTSQQAALQTQPLDDVFCEKLQKAVPAAQCNSCTTRQGCPSHDD